MDAMEQDEKTAAYTEFATVLASSSLNIDKQVQERGSALSPVTIIFHFSRGGGTLLPLLLFFKK